MFTLATVYVIALIVGGGLILISTLLSSHGDADVSGDLSGGHAGDHDFGGDGHHAGDADHHGGHHGMSLASWFSMQFVVFFLAIFGLVGTAMTYTGASDPMWVLIASIGGGAVVGQIVHQVLRALKRSGVASDLTARDFLDQPARVTIGFEGGRRGEIAIASKNGERFLAATAQRRDDRFSVGDPVVVVSLTGGVAEVVSRTEHEFVHPTKTGGSS